MGIFSRISYSGHTGIIWRYNWMYPTNNIIFGCVWKWGNVTFWWGKPWNFEGFPNFPHASICIQVYIVYTHTYGGLISHWGPQSIGHVVHGEWKPMLLGHSNFGKCPYDEHDEQHTVYRIQSNYQYWYVCTDLLLIQRILTALFSPSLWSTPG